MSKKEFFKQFFRAWLEISITTEAHLANRCLANEDIPKNAEMTYVKKIIKKGKLHCIDYLQFACLLLLSASKEKNSDSIISSLSEELLIKIFQFAFPPQSDEKNKKAFVDNIFTIFNKVKMANSRVNDHSENASLTSKEEANRCVHI